MTTAFPSWSRLILAAGVCACGHSSPPEPPVRLVVDISDTLVVSSRYPVMLPVRAVDARGGAVDGAPVRYSRIDGDTLPLTPVGAVTCLRSGEMTVRASLGSLTKRFVVQCRLVEYVRIPGPLQFVLGDSALSQPLRVPVAAYGADRRPINHFMASMGVGNSEVATLRGGRLSARGRGITFVSARVGDRDAAMGVHVYQRVSSLAAIDTLLRVRPEMRLFAVPLRLNPGEFLRQHLPRGDWMLVMLPEEDVAPDRVQLRVEGAQCRDHFLNGSPRRWGCNVNADASVVLYRPPGRASATMTNGYLLVRWLFT